VWDINTKAYHEAHFATFPPALIAPCILSSTRPGDFVLDPFFGSGTAGLVASDLDRKYVGIELNPSYIGIAAKRLSAPAERVVRLAA
jgi:site-specific DNA-methyltransferase (adenine-specific)